MVTSARNHVGRAVASLVAAGPIFSRVGLFSALRAMCLVLLLGGGAAAQTHIWIAGNGINNNWGNSFNWQNLSIPPTNGLNTAIIMRGTGLVSTVADVFGNEVDWHINSLTFDSLATESVLVNGGGLVVNNLIRNNNHRINTLSLPIKLGDASLDIDAVAGALHFFDEVRFTQNNSILAIRGGHQVFFGGGITRDASVTASTVTINEDTPVRLGGNTSGVSQWNVNDGTLELQSGGGFNAGASVHVHSGGRLDLRSFDATIGRLTGSGPVVTGSESTGFGELTVGSSSDFTYSGVIFGKLTKIGSGTFTMTGGLISDPSIVFSTMIDEGTLKLGPTALIGSRGVAISSGATFDLDGRSQTFEWLTGSGAIRLGGATLTLDPSENRQFSGRIDGPGTVRMSGSGTQELTNADNTFSTLQISSGTVTARNAGALGSGNIVIDNATLRQDFFSLASITSSRPISLSSSASKVYIESQRTWTQNAVISGVGGLTKLGGGTLVLGANNTYSGTTTISAGTLRLGAANRINNASDIVMGSGATFELSNTGSETVASLSGQGTLDTRTSARLTVNAAAGSTTFAGTIIGGGGINKAGGHTLLLTGNNTYTGATNIIGGTLQGSVGNSSLVTVSTGATWHLNGVSHEVGAISGGGAINVQGTTLAVTENSSSTRLFSGNISGTGGLWKRGTHTLVLSGNNSYLTTRIFEGMLSVGSSSNLGSGAIVFSGGTLFTSETFSNSRSLVINDGATAVLNVKRSTMLTQSGAISGTGLLAKAGGGTLLLSGTNTFVGELYLQEGVLSVAASANLGHASVPVIFFGGTLHTTASFQNDRAVTIGPFNTGTFDVNASTMLTQSGSMNGGADTTLIKEGGGTLKIFGDLQATYSGAIEVGAGTLELFHNASGSFGGNIGGDGNLHKAGAGVYTVSGNLTYGGGTSVQAGTLRRSGGSGLPNSTDLHIAAGAIYDLDNASDTINALTGAGSVTLGSTLVAKTLTVGSAGGSGTFSGAISGTLGHLAKTGAGAQILTGNNTYAQTFFNGGDLSTGASANLGSGQLNFNGGTWQVTGSFNNSRNIAIGAANFGTINVASGQTLTQTGTISGVQVTLNKTGNGTLALSGSAVIRHMNVDAGLLRFSGGNGLTNTTNVSVAAGATWDLNGVSDTVETIAGTGTIQLNDLAQLTVGGNSGSKTFSGAISGTGTLIKAGSHQLTLSDAKVESGGTAIHGGILTIASDLNLGSAGAPLAFDGGTLQTTGAFFIQRDIAFHDNGGTFDVGSGELELAGPLSGRGALAKSGAGTLRISDDATAYGGPISISEGALLVNTNAEGAPVAVTARGLLGGNGTVLSIDNAGHVNPGNSTAALHVAANFAQQASGVLEVGLGGLLPGVEHDQLTVGGMAVLGGTLSVSLLDNFKPEVGNQFPIITASGGVSGDFTDEILPSLSSNLQWNVVYRANSVVLEVAAFGLDGDYNNDGTVDAADYTVWRDGLGSIFTPGDYDVWKNNFGATSASGSAVNRGVVPEPSSILLAALAIALLAGRRGATFRKCWIASS